VQEQTAPYIDDLGPATVYAMDVDANDVDPSAPVSQMVGVAYEVSATDVVSVSVDGYAPEEFAKLQPSDCNPEGSHVSCSSEVRPDGSRVTTEVQAYSQTSAGPGIMETIEPDEAAAHPDKVWWGRSVQAGNSAGMTLVVTEFVKAPTVGAVQWLLPSEVLTSLATDPAVLDPAGVAHAPICHSAQNTC
jgi:hypothetical protein